MRGRGVNALLRNGLACAAGLVVLCETCPACGRHGSSGIGAQD